MTLYFILGFAAAGLEATFLALLRLGDLKANVVEYIALMFGAALLYLVSIYVVLRLKDSKGLLAFLFMAGICFRATLAPLYPSLSDDLLHYRWEGKAQLAGLNPYRVAPDSPLARGIRDETWPAVNGKQFTSMYPPLTELTYRETFRAFRGWPVVWMKFPALFFDLGTAVLLILLLRRMRLAATRALVYLWCPLVVVEFAASGHNDSISLFFLTAALLAVEWTRPQAATESARLGPAIALAALTASALSKLFAVFLAPALLVREWKCLTSRRGLPLLWSALVAAAICLPYRHALPNIVPALAVASGHWRNNDSLFGLVADATSITAASRVYMVVVAVTSLVLAIRKAPFTRAAYLLIGTVLLGAANCFPWYLTWIIPLQAIYLNPAWLLLTATSQLAYQVLIQYQTTGLWQDSSFFRALEYLPVYAMLVAGMFTQKRRVTE